ncbi:MAG: M6 family metalloprotease domain-containing protein [Flammeovirgaceae bacterium]|nr:M6 family metalloprotease domain-containing protein [Flammeovirgaceae bacterium]
MKIFLTAFALISFVFISEIKAQIPISDCPASPYAIDIAQPDGTKISIIGKGSMKNSWTETLDGYSIVKNKDGVYEYAQKDNNRLIPSGFLVQEDKNNVDNQNFLDKQTKHLRSTITTEELTPARITDTSAENNPGINLAFPTQGTHKVLVLLIDYPDLTATHTVAEFENFMNQEDYNDTGSFRDYYLKVSGNKLDVNADVVGWYRADSAYEYYGKKNGYERTRGLVREAVDAAEAAGVDFSIYDNDEDGYIDGIILVHAGQGAEEGSLEDYIWSHRSSLGSDYYRTYDDIIINDYMVNPERRVWSNSGAGGMVGIGVFCHEFGHGLNLPDLYDIDYSSAGVGSWGLMAGATWLGDEKVPGFMSAWSRVTLGWITPEKISSGSYALVASTTSTVVYKINTAVPGEYFLLENRQQIGQDTYLEGSGLAIWHIDDNRRVSDNSDNSDESHRLVDLEQADGLGHLYIEDGASDDGDLFPGSSENTSFTDATSPNSKTYNLVTSGIEITGISEESGIVNFNVSGGDERYDPVDVIFSLDLSNYASAQNPPYIYGEWDNFCTNCNAMADTDDDGIWTDTISMGRGDYKFIFLTGAAFVTGTDYEGFSGVATDCNVLAEAGSVFTTDHYFRSLQVLGETEFQFYGGNTVKWNDCPVINLTMNITAANSTEAIANGVISNDDSLVLTFTSSQGTVDFSAEDITAAGGIISDFSETSTSVYTAIFTPLSDGATSIDVAAGTFTDVAGNSNTAASQFNWTYDGTLPIMEITATNTEGVIAQNTVSNDSALTITFTSSEETEDFVVDDITVSGGIISDFSATSASIYTATFTPSADGATTIGVAAGTFEDAAGNTNLIVSQFNWTYDVTSPTMEITAANSEGPVGQGTTSSDAALTLTFTSSEETDDFTVDDIIVTGGIISDFSATSASIYTTTFTPSADGATTIDVAAGTFEDAAGNNNTAASQFNWTYEEEVLKIDLLEQSVPFAFHPNPAQDIMHIRVSNIKEVEVLEMFNLSGKKVLNFRSDVGQVDLTRLPEGIYLIRSNNNLMRPQKIIISK